MKTILGLPDGSAASVYRDGRPFAIKTPAPALCKNQRLETLEHARITGFVIRAPILLLVTAALGEPLGIWRKGKYQS
jgi:hypothetical protein